MTTDRLHERAVQGLHAALFARLPPLPPSAPILDLGCGTGAWLQRLADAGHTRLTGVDADAKEFGARDVEFLCGDLEAGDVGLGERQFELVSAIEVLEHIQNTGLLLDLAARHLRPGGWLLLTTPNIQSALSRLRFLLTGRLAHFDDRGDPTHVGPLLLPSLTRLLDLRGLRVDSVWTHPPAGPGASYRRLSRVLGTFVGKFVPNERPGDVLCLLARRA